MKENKIRAAAVASYNSSGFFFFFKLNHFFLTMRVKLGAFYWVLWVNPSSNLTQPDPTGLIQFGRIRSGFAHP